MRALIQRVSSAEVTVDAQAVGAIGAGLLVLLGIHKRDTPDHGQWLIRKLLSVRVFEDEAGKMGRSILDVRGEILVISQFTLYGETDKGTRPDFSRSMPGEEARAYYERWLAQLRQACDLKIEAGRFAAKMDVRLVNSGPVTLMLDSGVS